MSGLSRSSWQRVTRPVESGGAGPQDGGSTSLSVLLNHQLLRKALPGLLQSDTGIELVGVLPARCGRQEQKLAPARASLRFHFLDERATDSSAPMRLVHDERTDLRRGAVTLERRRHLEMCEPDDGTVELGDDDTVTHDREALESSRHGASVGGIAQLCEQGGDLLPVGGLRLPDRQTHATRL